MKPDLSVNIAGIVMQNPLMNAAGTQNIESEDDAKLARVYNQGAHVQKSITRRGRQGNDQPRICEVTAGMINRIGLQNVGVELFLKDKMGYFNHVKELSEELKSVLAVFPKN